MPLTRHNSCKMTCSYLKQLTKGISAWLVSAVKVHLYRQYLRKGEEAPWKCIFVLKMKRYLLLVTAYPSPQGEGSKQGERGWGIKVT